MRKTEISEKLKSKFLQEIAIFSTLSTADMTTLIPRVKFRGEKKGTVLFNQGDEGREMFVVLSGEIGISIRISDDEEKEIASFRAGNFFGEMSLFEKVPRSAKAYAKKESDLLMLDEEGFFSLIEEYPHIAVLIMHKMANITTGRLQQTNNFVADIVRWGDKARLRAIIDEFTGAYNRRYFDEAIGEMFLQAQNNGKPFSVVMVDLDFFREINETYSHEVGDQVIKAAAAVFQTFLRKTDILVRYGGDEFVFLLPATTSSGAYSVCERIRKEVGKLDMLKKLKGRVNKITTSQGIATFPDNAEDVKELREKADLALYRAKDEGRNRVVCYE